MAKKLYRVIDRKDRAGADRNWFVVAKSEEKAVKQILEQFEVDDEDSVEAYEYDGVVEIGSYLSVNG